MTHINPLSANPAKWSNTLKQLAGKLLTNCLSVFDHFVILGLKGLKRLLTFYFYNLAIFNQETYPYFMSNVTQAKCAILIGMSQLGYLFKI